MEKAADSKPHPPVASRPPVDRFNVPDISPQDQGLKVLYDPSDVDAIDVDIVAVHGIMARPNSTWTHGKTKVNWLSDESMLPASLRKHEFGARIMAFGYESKWFGSGSVKQSLANLANDLLLALNEKREACPQRPIIFIAHCFGGLIAQKAYTKAALQEKDFRGIWRSTRGIVFLGTPHRGVNDGTNMTKQGQIYDAIVAKKMQIQDGVLLTVTRDNDVLVETVSEFTRKVSTTRPPLLLFSFFEMKPTNVGAIIGQEFVPEFVVGESSATLEGHEKLGLSLDHFSINKFESDADGNYGKVFYQVLRMTRLAKAVSERGPPGLGKASSPAPDSRVSILPGILRKRQYFAPRHDVLKRLEDRISTKRGMAALCGESGSGKTHVAVEYVDSYVQKNGASNCQVFWVNAGSPEEFEASYKRIGAKLRVPAVGVSHDAYLSAIRDHLKEDEEWLMILDGLNDDDSLRSTNPDPGTEARCLLSAFLPKASDSHRILITTTNYSLAVRQMNSKDKYVISLQDLNKEDASRLLLGKITTDPARRRRIDELVKILGDSAGTLELVRLCGIIHKKGVSSELLAMLREQCKEGIAGESPKPAWDLLWSSLKMKNSDAAYWLQQIGLLDVQMIPNVFFSNNDRKTRLEELTGLGLVEVSDGRSYYRVPAFFRQCLRSSLNERHRAEAEAAILQSVNNKFDEDNRNVLLPVALAALKLNPSHLEGKRAHEALREKVASHRRQRQASLSPGIGMLTEDTGRLSIDRDWGDIVRRAIEASSAQRAALPMPNQHPLSEDRSIFQSSRLPNTLKSSSPELEQKREEMRRDSRLAAQMLLENKPPANGSEDAATIYRRVIDRYSDDMNPQDYLKLAGFQYNLGIAQGSKGLVDDAAATFRQALHTIEAGHDPAIQDADASKLFYRIYTDLASMYASNGRLVEAQEAFLHFLPSQAKELGRDSQQTLKARHEFARLLQERGEAQLGGAELERLLRVSEGVLGRDHRDTLTVRCSVAQHFARSGRRDEAVGMLLGVEREQTRLLGRDHRETAATRELLDEIRQTAVV